MKKILSILIILTIFSCTPEKEKKEKIMAEEIKKAINEAAFKQNGKANIIEFKFLGHDTIDQNYIDTLSLIKYADKLDQIIERMRLQNSLTRNLSQRLRLLNDIDRGGNLWINTKEDYENSQNDFKKLSDSAKYYSDHDSITRKTITTRKSHSKYFRAKIFLKATMEAKGKQENVMDTLNFYFTEALKLKKL